jgi:hypothetical protein
MRKTYNHGKNNVIVAEDGGIVVKKGDWLSRYYSAIHQRDVSKSDIVSIASEFGRMGKGAKVLSFREQGDINKIMVGETLYHIPSTFKLPPRPVAGSKVKPIVVDLSKAVDGGDMFINWLSTALGLLGLGGRPGGRYGDVHLSYEPSGSVILKHVLRFVKPWQYYTRKSAMLELWQVVELNCGAGKKFYTTESPISVDLNHVLRPVNDHAVKAWESATGKKWVLYWHRLRAQCAPERFT